MRMYNFIAGFVLFLVAACAAGGNLTPRQQLAAAEISFTTAVQQVTVYCQTGQLDVTTCSHAKQAIIEGDQALDQARLTIDMPNSNVWVTALSTVDGILRRLAVAQAQVKR